jgi:hypothetical protein
MIETLRLPGPVQIVVMVNLRQISPRDPSPADVPLGRLLRIHDPEATFQR